jgi:isoleucyl-tRNA synthetase
VPIAVFFCEGCNTALNDKKVNRAVVDLFKLEGADAWYKHEAAQILPGGTKCSKCGGTNFRKEMDIIDVWFESGSSHAAVLGHEAGLPWPSDLYFEGGDQYRGWFHSSLLCAVGAKNSSPYRSVATSGWTLDENGRAMSKSLGNVVDPVDIAKRLGGEIVRLWVASVDFREDVAASENLMNRVAENYRKIRNSFRYILGNLHGFDPLHDAVPFEELQALDQYMQLRTVDFTKEVLDWSDQMLFHRIYQRLNEFCVNDLSAIYFDVLKDRLYTSAPNSKARKSAQTALWRIGEALVRLVAPIMSFTAEEIWQSLPTLPDREASVHLAYFPSSEDITGTLGATNVQQLRSDWDTLFTVRQEANKAMEGARSSKLIGQNLEAQIVIAASGNLYDVLQRNLAQIRPLLIVSDVQLVRSESGNGSAPVNVTVNRAPGEKCERCWNYSTHVGEDKNYPTICERCSGALREIEG